MKYKTELCKAFNLTGKCMYEEDCAFAHGNEDLRDIIKPCFYKKIECIKFNNGYCPYGSRCVFIHKINKNRYIYYTYKLEMIKIELEEFLSI